jgi:hypothetical protein
MSFLDKQAITKSNFTKASIFAGGAKTMTLASDAPGLRRAPHFCNPAAITGE